MKGTGYLTLLLLHSGLGLVIYLYEPLAKLYLVAILMFFLVYIINKRNRNNEALLAAAYMAGAEVFLRMNDGFLFYETGKYAVMLFLGLGLFFKGASRKAYPFWIYLLILMPGILVAAAKLDYDEVFRQEVAFNLSGPVCLGISAIYCFHKKIGRETMEKVLLMFLLPLLSTMCYLFLYTPQLADVLLSGTSSNFATSAGFGPNQVSTVLGMGVFVLFARLFTIKNRWINLVDLVLLLLMSYRAVLTFSRGGVLTAFFCMCCFLFLLYVHQRPEQRPRTLRKVFLIAVAGAGLLFFTGIATQGLVANRYFNLNMAGPLQNDFTTGRTKLILMEVDGFRQQPFLGLGVGKAKDSRAGETGIVSASHNEFSRLLSEHGFLGLFAASILLCVPLYFWMNFRGNHYFLALLAFWFLTVSHSAMRVAMPALAYGLALLFIVDEKKDSPYR